MGGKERREKRRGNRKRLNWCGNTDAIMRRWGWGMGGRKCRMAQASVENGWGEEIEKNNEQTVEREKKPAP